MTFRPIPMAIFLVVANSGCGADKGWSALSCPGSEPVNGGAIAVDSAQGALEVMFSLDVTGTGSGPIGAIGIRQNQGRIAIQGVDLPILSYESTKTGGFTVHQAIAVADRNWYSLWLYCRDNQLTQVWLEGTDGTILASHSASGQCAHADTQTTLTVAFPSSSVDTVHLRCGADVDGAGLTVHSGTGTLTFMTDVFTVMIVDAVDCSQCGGNGWFELHSLFWNPVRHDLGLGIIYLLGTQDDIVHRAGYGGQVAYWLSLPSLTYVSTYPIAVNWSLK